MTDNEIKKALECKIKFKCNECPYFDGFPCSKCHTMLIAVLDLINRLQAENDTLRTCVEQIPLIRKDGKSPLSLFTAEIKAEAYKEFAEKAKEFMHNKFKTLDEYEFEYITERDIDNLAKEMVGDDNA